MSSAGRPAGDIYEKITIKQAGPLSHSAVASLRDN